MLWLGSFIITHGHCSLGEQSAADPSLENTDGTSPDTYSVGAVTPPSCQVSHEINGEHWGNLETLLFASPWTYT